MTTTDMQQPVYEQPDYRKSQQKVVLTPEEKMAWQRCAKSSSVVGPAIVSAAIGYGLFRITPFRAQAKYAAVVGGVMGVLAGKVAISQMCLMKVASMPNSNLRDRLIEAGYYSDKPMSERQYRGFQSSGVMPEVQKSLSDEPGIVFDDYPPMNSFDAYSSLNDSGDILTTDDTDLTEPINIQKKSMSYDELRQRNREEYQSKTRQWYAPKVSERSPATAQQHIPAAVDNASNQAKTKYGDVWD